MRATFTEVYFLVVLAFAALPSSTLGAAPGKAEIDITTYKYTAKNDYSLQGGVEIRVGRGKKKDWLETGKTGAEAGKPNHGKVVIEVASGEPISLLFYMSEDFVPEIQYLSAKPNTTHRVAPALMSPEEHDRNIAARPGELKAWHKAWLAVRYLRLRNLTEEDKKILKGIENLLERIRPRTRVLVPAYFTRGNFAAWNTLNSAASQFKDDPVVPIVAIVKRESANQIPRLDKSRVTVIGHVDARFRRSKDVARMRTADVARMKADITNWYNRAPSLQGIFLDGQSVDDKETKYYAELADHIRMRATAAHAKSPLIIGNPGDDFPREYLEQEINQATCCFESSTVRSTREVVLPWWIEGAYYAGRAGVIVSNLKGQADMENIAGALLDQEVGYLYFTDKSAKPFTQMPSPNYWKRMLHLVREANRRDPDPFDHFLKRERELDENNRKAAEFVWSIKGKIRVKGSDEVYEDGAVLLGKSFRVTHIDLEKNKQVKDTDLARFRDCSDLEALRLDFTLVEDSGLSIFKGIDTLSYLNLEGTKVTDKGLANFRHSKTLKYLGVFESKKITDKGLEYFKGCKDLLQVQVGFTAMTDKGLLQFTECRNLQVMSLGGNPRITDAGIEAFRKALPKCEVKGR
jgi:hypothetical protein